MKPTLWSRFIKWCGFIFDSISNFVSRNFGSNVGLKILSVILAFVIILVISERTGVVKEFTVPVKITMKTKDTALSSYTPSEVKVSLKGTLEDLSVIDASLLYAEIIIDKDYKSGEQITRRLYSTNIKNNGNLRVEDISPHEIDIVFDKEARRKIPVALPNLEGSPLQGGTASVRFVSGHEVTVVGSELGLDRLGGVSFSSQPIDVSNRSASFEHDVEIVVPPDVGVKTIEPKKLKVFVEIILPQAEEVEGVSDSPQTVVEAEGEIQEEQEPSEEESVIIVDINFAPEEEGNNEPSALEQSAE